MDIVPRRGVHSLLLCQYRFVLSSPVTILLSWNADWDYSSEFVDRENVWKVNSSVYRFTRQSHPHSILYCNVLLFSQRTGFVAQRGSALFKIINIIIADAILFFFPVRVSTVLFFKKKPNKIKKKPVSSLSELLFRFFPFLLLGGGACYFVLFLIFTAFCPILKGSYG